MDTLDKARSLVYIKVHCVWHGLHDQMLFQLSIPPPLSSGLGLVTEICSLAFSLSSIELSTLTVGTHRR